jgi:hypothetical protein
VLFGFDPLPPPLLELQPAVRPHVRSVASPQTHQARSFIVRIPSETSSLRRRSNVTTGVRPGNNFHRNARSRSSEKAAGIDAAGSVPNGEGKARCCATGDANSQTSRAFPELVESGGIPKAWRI